MDNARQISVRVRRTSRFSELMQRPAELRAFAPSITCELVGPKYSSVLICLRHEAGMIVDHAPAYWGRSASSSRQSRSVD
eukprot:scaffold185735_cov19-Prasinocladus_malaysianus.AAC.1